MTRKPQIVILIVVVIIVALVIVTTPLASKALSEILPGSFATKESIDPYKEQIIAFQDELQKTDLSSETRSLIEEKLTSISMMATQRAAGKVNQPTRQVPSLATPTIEVASSKLPDGIDDHPSVPISESVVTVLNSWRKTTESQYYLVYAGFLTQESQQGAILVLHPWSHEFMQYNTPNMSGGVRVVGEKGTIITLQSAEGVQFNFDVARELFIDSNGAPVPTNTVMPLTPSPIIRFTPTSISPYP